MRRHALALSLAVGSVTACTRAESYGFIATLGNDTTSIEHITRTRDRIIGDQVERSPVVVRRHWEATLADDGTISKWFLDTHIYNTRNGKPVDLHHEAVFGDKAVRLRRRVASDSTDVAYEKRYAVTVPWNAFMYGSYEVLFDMATTRPDSTHIGQFFFEGWDEGHIGYAQVKKLGDGAYSITSTGLAGAGVGHLDDKGRMLSYSGQGTTYKQEVKRVTVANLPDIDAVATRFAAAEKAAGVKRALSVRDTVRATVAGAAGTADIMIDYSRPLARGRTLVGGLIPYDEVWRTGANAATQLMVSKPITLAGVPLKPGTYTLWTLPTKSDVKLVINRKFGQWGTEYSPRMDLARAPMQVETTTTPVEQFTIRIEKDALVMEWGTFRWKAPITVPSNGL
jgi:hypothetical protein